MNATTQHIAEHPFSLYLIQRAPVVGPDVLSTSMHAGGMGAATRLYSMVPAEAIQKTVHKLFPNLSKCPYADLPPFGKYHRFYRGHDLVIDVANTYRLHGSRAAWHHFGHILLTDFPTKAGIPIPVISHIAKSTVMDVPVLGEALRLIGLDRVWLNLSLFDGAMGTFALCGSASNLGLAIAGQLPLNFGTVASTYGTGTFELLLSKSLVVASTNFNPLLWYSGVLNITSGVIATWKAFLVYVSPAEILFGAALPGVIGAGLGWALTAQAEPRERRRISAKTGLRSALAGALFSITPAFGYGALGAMTAWSLGVGLARLDARRRRQLLTLSSPNNRQSLPSLLGVERPQPMTQIPRPMTQIPQPMTQMHRPMTKIPQPITQMPRPITEMPRPMTEAPAPMFSPFKEPPQLCPRPSRS